MSKLKRPMTRATRRRLKKSSKKVQMVKKTLTKDGGKVCLVQTAYIHTQKNSTATCSCFLAWIMNFGPRSVSGGSFMKKSSAYPLKFAQNLLKGHQQHKESRMYISRFPYDPFSLSPSPGQADAEAKIRSADLQVPDSKASLSTNSANWLRLGQFQPT